MEIKKICNKCLVEKNLNDFSILPGCKDGHRNKCKECKKIENKDYNRKKSFDKVTKIKIEYIENEKWVEIPNYEGIYEVSNYGRIRSLDREIDNRKYYSRMLKSSNCKGYRRITLSKNGIYTKFLVHQLVMIGFKNHTPNRNEIQVDHINRNKIDNRLENLRLVNNRENCSNKDNNNTYIGTCYDKARKYRNWQSSIMIDNGPVFLGNYETQEEAGYMYIIALKYKDVYYGNKKEFRLFLEKLSKLN